MGNKLLIAGHIEKEENINTLEININDYVNQTNDWNNYSHVFKNLKTLASQFRDNIVNKMQNIKESQQYRQKPAYDPLRVQPANPRQPYISPLMEPGYGQPYQPPFSIGRDDINPFPSSIPFDGPGNLMGPRHPGFGPLVTDPFGGSQDPLRGRGPQPLPGARFDPFGPPGSGNTRGDPDRDNEPPGVNYDYFL